MCQMLVQFMHRNHFLQFLNNHNLLLSKIKEHQHHELNPRKNLFTLIQNVIYVTMNSWKF